jgi:hypothetical protein
LIFERLFKAMFWIGLLAIALWFAVAVGIHLRCPVSAIWTNETCGGDAAMWMFPVLTLPLVLIVGGLAYWLRRFR